MAYDDRGSLKSLLESFFTSSNPMASRTNTYAIRFAKGDEHKKTPNYPDFLRSLEGEKKVMGLYNAFQDSSSFKKIGNDSDAAVSKRHRIFHTWLVAIISAILQLINETGRLKKDNYLDNNRVEGKYLGLLSNPETLKGIVEYTSLPTVQTGITEFNMQQSQGVLVGFTWKFRNDSLGCSMVGRVQQEHLIINTIFTEFENRMREARSAISKGPQHFQEAVAAYSTVINLRTGNISSQEVSTNPFDNLVEDLGNMTINTTVKAVNSTNPFANFEPSTYNTRTDSYNPFDEFPLEIEEVVDDGDGKQFARNIGDVDFGRKKKRKLSRKRFQRKGFKEKRSILNIEEVV